MLFARKRSEGRKENGIGFQVKRFEKIERKKHPLPELRAIQLLFAYAGSSKKEKKEKKRDQ